MNIDFTQYQSEGDAQQRLCNSCGTYIIIRPMLTYSHPLRADEVTMPNCPVCGNDDVTVQEATIQ